MDDEKHLRPATTEEIADSIAFALRYEGRKRVNHADEMMARITADRLVRHLRGSGFVVMRQPEAPAPTDKPTPGPSRSKGT
ncbi:hypothetical protein [Rhodopila sp.]|uniref:hypothetical protein n=1 Tax=Rhodopila sp. TaxID=2480087 RepID=UPI003D0BA7F2